MGNDLKIIHAIWTAVDEVNEHLPPQHKIQKSLDTRLLDGSSQMDSFALVSLMTAIEQKIEEAYNVSINLVDGCEASEMERVLVNVETLAAHVTALVGASKR